MAGTRSGAASKSRLNPSSDLEFARDPNFFVLGLDEVGVGCLAGPVVAACYAYRLSDFVWPKGAPKVGDSKRLSEAQRLEARIALESAPGVEWAIGEASPNEIDTINILRASQLAMECAFRSVAGRLGARGFRGENCVVLVDGNRLPPFLKVLPLASVQTLVKGDARSFAIASASILAKECRDTFMVEAAKRFPAYGWESNVGYPTPTHKAAIALSGFTELHRRSFNAGLDVSEAP